MSRRLLVFSCSVLLLGCSHTEVDMNKQLEKANKTQFVGRGGQSQPNKTPEYIAGQCESPQALAHYLRGLASDGKFEPKQHVEMLKKYEDDSNTDVAEAAKELLAKAQ
jgi:hypothetical protein